MLSKKLPRVLSVSILFVVFLILVGVGMWLFNTSQNDIVVSEDYLLYTFHTEQQRNQLMFYDPDKDVHTPVLPGWRIENISMSMTDRLAFLSAYEGVYDVYILDYPFTENTPVKITKDISSYEYAPLKWSPDGQYLAYVTVQGDGKTLKVWDGKTSTSIHNYQETVSQLAWSQDGRLAFTEFYTFIFPYDGDPSEIFVWDGDVTVSVSQTPFGNDGHPTWSDDGQLAFLSEWKDEEYDIFIWDGVSKIDDIPDASTYKNIAPHLTWYHSYPVWTSSGSLSFEATGRDDRRVQIYEWDGETATNISQNPRLHNGGQSWRSDGYWAFMSTYTSGRIYIRDANNHTVYDNTENEEEFVGSRPAWSPDGRLLFCSLTYAPNGSSEFILWIWDDTNIIEVARDVGMAMWKNGKDTYCAI